MPLPDGPLARALPPERIAERLHRAPALDHAALAAWLPHADPVLTALARVAPEAVRPVALALLDAAVDLVARGLTGADHPLLARVWRELLPAAAGPLAESPELVAALSNAAWHLDAEPAARGDVWIDRLLAALPRCASADELRGAALVLAWRAGLAPFRDAARRRFAVLPAPLAAHLVAEPTLGPEEQAHLFDHPWIPPSKRHLPRRLTLVGSIGGFRGFGGSFVTPPLLGRLDGQFVAWDADGLVLVHVDAYGSTLRRAPLAPPGPAPLDPAFTLDPEGTVTHAGASRAFPLLAGAASAVADATTLIVSLPHSHHLFVIACAPVEPR